MAAREPNAAWDILFVGGGAGVEGAIRAAELGLRAAVVERDRLGGTLVHWGAVPLEALFTGIGAFKQAAAAEAFGVRLARPVLDYSALLRKQAQIRQELEDHLQARLDKSGASLIRGEAALKEPGVVSVMYEGRVALHQAKRIVVATGSQPNRPSTMVPDGVQVLTTDDALRLHEIPDSLCIVGAGPAGCEFAALYASLGAQVTLLERETALLPAWDAGLSRFLSERLRDQGVRIIPGVSRIATNRIAEGVQLAIVADGERQTVAAEKVLLCTGRISNTNRLGLERLGVAMDGEAFVQVDARMQTSLPGLSACGDVVGGPMLAHRANFQARRIAELEAGETSASEETFGVLLHGFPPIASVGLSEAQARAQFGDGVQLIEAQLEDSHLVSFSGEHFGYGKLVSQAEGKLVGAHFIGEFAGQALAVFTVAVRQGLRVEDLRGAGPVLGGFPWETLLRSRR